MGEVDRITRRTAAALLAMCAALAALPVAAGAAPPTCTEPFELTVQGDTPPTYEPNCTDDDAEPIAYALADPQPLKGEVALDGSVFTYTADDGAAGADEFGFTATAGGEPVTYTVAVTIKAPPTVTLDASPTTATTGQTVTFTATATDPDGGDEFTYSWTVDSDQPFAGGATIERAFPTVGNHAVTVTVTDDDGDMAPATVPVEITAPPNQPPLAAFDFAPARPVAGQVVTFTSGAGDPEGGELDLAWDLDGDGAFGDAAGQTAATTYATAGRRVVRLRATDPEGAATVAERTVDVAAAPPPATQPSTPPPAGPPPPPPDPPPPDPLAFTADTTAPAFAVARTAGQRLRRVRRRGLRFAVRCDEPCSVYLELLVSRATARRLKIDRRARRAVRIGRLYTTGGPVRRSVRVKLARSAARRLRRARRVTLTLQGSAFDAGGYTTLLKPRRLVIRR